MRIKQKEYKAVALFLAGIALGTIMAVLFRDTYKEKISIYQSEFRQELIQFSLTGWEFFLYIFRVRFFEICACFLISITILAYPAFELLTVYSGFCMAGMIVTATLTRGKIGLILFLSSVMPHYIFYGAAVILLIVQSCFQRHPQHVVLSYLFIGGVFFLGIVSEALWNPLLMKLFL